MIAGLSCRYLAVVFPVSSKTLRTNHNTGLALGLAWALSLLLSCPAIFLHGLIGSRAVEEQVQSLATTGFSDYFYWQINFCYQSLLTTF